jgi:pimeloyl-ACP methyl ester carboxylesterase
LGWSERRPGPRDADHIAGELHGLLLSAHVAGPIILMGHSVGGLYIRDYASRYPADVAGIVFVDSVTPSPPQNHGLNRPLIMTMISRPIFILGIPRLLGFCSRPKPGFDAATGILQREDLCHTEYGPVLNELEGRGRSDQQTTRTGPYGELPILILSADPAQRQWGNQWEQAQEDLKKLSIRSRRIIARGSGHYVQFDRPELIEKEVPLFIEQIRGEIPLPTNYRSTTTE